MDSKLTNLKSENTAPAEGAVAVTPSDSTDLTSLCRALYVGSGGTVNVDVADGSTVAFVGVIGGTILPVRVARVRATGTTATNIVALY
jgi:hypothetical protein